MLTLAQAPTPGITGSPEGTAILSIEDRRAPTAHDLAVLVEATRSTQPFIQHAAIRALGRLERRDVVTNLLPLLALGLLVFLAIAYALALVHSLNRKLKQRKGGLVRA